jgi:hypothetical protein
MSRVEHIGRATLYLGDCRDILPTLGPVDHVITDPPYSQRTHANHDGQDNLNRPLGYAALSPPDVERFAELLHSTARGWVVWFTDAELAHHVRTSFDRLGRATFAPLPFYHHGRSVRFSGDGPSSWTDWICVARTSEISKWGTLRGGYISGEGWNEKLRKGGKPEPLMGLVVSDYSRQAETVCDPFMGAGTTGVACVKQSRNFVGIEIDAAAFDIACKRIEEAQRQGDFFVEAA